MAVIVKDDNIQTEKLDLAPYGTNAYIVARSKKRNGLLMDNPA